MPEAKNNASNEDQNEIMQPNAAVALRDERIPLPDSQQCPHVLFVGTTGAGKTTLLRQLIGTTTERFPSTSTARTTIADTEVIQAEGDYEAIISFFTKDEIRTNVEECITEAILRLHRQKTKKQVQDAFLSHLNQKFRLSYVLGRFSTEDSKEEEDVFATLDDPTELESQSEEDGVSSTERERNRAVLEGFIEQITAIYEEIKSELPKKAEKGNKPQESNGEIEEQSLGEALEAGLQDNKAFDGLIASVLEAIQKRFGGVGAGEYTDSPSGWPQSWYLKSPKREDFIQQVRWFTSNVAHQFGRLLTPLVNGVRVKGPFFPSFYKTPLVLLDGQGLGHKAETAFSVSTSITERFEKVSVILLVDNAEQPMLAWPLAALRAVAAHGYSRKLAIALTHFDRVRGDNLNSSVAKRDHVTDSVDQALDNLNQDLGDGMTAHLQESLHNRCFMLGALDQNLEGFERDNHVRKNVQSNLKELVDFCVNALKPLSPPEAKPVYSAAGLVLAVREAVNEFRSPWQARLGLKNYRQVKKEHWGRIKALNRRIAEGRQNEYNTLKPVADLIKQLVSAFSFFLDSPLRWKDEQASVEDKQAVIDAIRQKVSKEIHLLAEQRIITEHKPDWLRAYEDLRGLGSASKRADAIWNIYKNAAPTLDIAMTPQAQELLKELREIVFEAIQGSEGEVEG